MNPQQRLLAIILGAGVLVVMMWYTAACRVPVGFPTGSLVTIAKGQTLSEVAESLHEQHIIQSVFWFKAFVTLLHGQGGLIAGDYFFDKSLNLFSVEYRLTSGRYGLTPIKVTIPEGSNISEIKEILAKKFHKFDPKVFSDSAKEGYLFPDTYLFLPNVEALQIVDVMRENFDKRVATVQQQISAFGRPLADVIKIASIVEEEARTTETRRTIAGILWKRLDKGMPLQVDVTFQYINGKTTEQLSLDDLKIDSPYNTYVYKGLPPTPISNPGLDSILASVTPIPTAYYFFLSDKNGIMHYAVTFDQHIANKELYLNR